MKNIGKIKAIIISSIVTLVLIAGLIFSFVPMKLGNKDYESFAGALNQGISINGGMSVEYTIKGTYTDKQLNSSLAKITELVQEYGYESVVAYKKGEDKIRVDLNGPVLYDDRTTAESFLKQIATGKLEFKNKNDAKAITVKAYFSNLFEFCKSVFIIFLPLLPLVLKILQGLV